MLRTTDAWIGIPEGTVANKWRLVSLLFSLIGAMPCNQAYRFFSSRGPSYSLSTSHNIAQSSWYFPFDMDCGLHDPHHSGDCISILGYSNQEEGSARR